MKSFTFNGKTSEQLGLVIKNMPPVPRAERDIESLAISGRTGNLHIDNKNWKAKSYTIECICKDLTKADLIKSTLWGTHQLTLSDYSDRYFIATIKNQIDFDTYLTYLQSFPLEMELQPIAYGNTEVTTEIETEYVTGEGTNITINNTGVAKLSVGLKGDTSQASDPTPTSPIPVEVVTGNQNILVQNKNLASLKTSSSQTIAGLPFTIENGIFKVNGTASSNGGFYFDSFRANSGTATFTFEITGYTKGGSNNGSVILQVSDDNTTFTNLSQQYFSSPSASVQVTLDSTKYYRIRPYFASGNVFANSTLKIQLEYGNTKTDFVAHQEQTYSLTLGTNEICKMPNTTYEDTIIGTPDNWKIHREIGKIVYNGTETDLAIYNSTASRTVISTGDITDIEALESASVTPNLLCNYFTPVSTNTTWAYGMVSRRQQNNKLYFTLNSGETTDSFKTWLSTHNTNVYYVLATPIEETITDETLIEELNNLYNNAVSYLDQTNLSATGNLPFIMSASALKKGTNEAIINNGGNVEVAPIITIGSAGSLTVNGYIITTSEDDITIDCDLMECYNGNVAKNNKVTLDEFPVLSAGNNTIQLGTADDVIIKHRSGWL